MDMGNHTAYGKRCNLGSEREYLTDHGYRTE